jgi:hypothetical protein
MEKMREMRDLDNIISAADAREDPMSDRESYFPAPVKPRAHQKKPISFNAVVECAGKMLNYSDAEIFVYACLDALSVKGKKREKVFDAVMEDAQARKEKTGNAMYRNCYLARKVKAHTD